MRSVLLTFILCAALNVSGAPGIGPMQQVRYLKTLQDFKKTEKVDGLACALLDHKTVLWQACLGHSTYDRPIDERTLFSIQSISKTVTAVAVLRAVQEGLMDLDAPVVRYWPDFTVHSCFASHPEKSITMRMLLTHTAGFTHEAPVGNNYDFQPCSRDAHIQSIKDTWLRFSPGSDWAYSNLGFDLAAALVEKASGIPFNQYLKQKLFVPLDMSLTTVDDEAVRKISNRTEGTIQATESQHLTNPLLGSGAVYTNLREFAKFVQMFLNQGKIGETVFLTVNSLNEMYRITAADYGMGLAVGKTDSIHFINHNGAGYGYSATFIAFPEYGLAAVLLCNKQCNTFALCDRLVDMYLKEFKPAIDESITKQFTDLNAYYFSNKEKINNTPLHICSTDTLFKPEWKKYIGEYQLILSGLKFKWYAKAAFALGFYPQKLKIEKQGAVLKISSNYGVSVLREYKPGFFFTNGGEVVDFTGSVPTYKNIKLEKK